MALIYISIEKNIEVFEFYKALWSERGIAGVMADTMTEGIAKAIEIEKSTTDDLFFIDIVADDTNYMPQLKILRAETNAPVLIATSKFDEDERNEALQNGAAFYDKYCELPEKNIASVLSVICSIELRAETQRQPSRVLIHDYLLITPDEPRVFVNDAEVRLTPMEHAILHYLISNKGRTRSFEQIFHRVWDNDYMDASAEQLRNHVSRINKKLPGNAQIANSHGMGYKIST